VTHCGSRAQLQLPGRLLDVRNDALNRSPET
jgi:hypothetical protein